MDELWCPVRDCAIRDRSAPAVVDSGTELSYGKLDRLVEQHRAMLRSRRVKPGELVALRFDNSVAFVSLFWALLRHGAVACVLSTRQPLTQLVEALYELGARLILVDHPVEVDPELVEQLVVNPLTRVRDDENTGFSERLAFDAGASTVLYTTGSTGNPKAVLHHLAAHFSSALGSQQILPVHWNDRWLVILPFYHAGGLSILFRCFLHGGTVVIPAGSDKLGVDCLVRGVDYISAVPTQLRRLLDSSQLDRIRRPRALLLGGSATPPRLVEEATAAGFTLALTYGSTEMASQVCTTPPSTKPAQLRSAGLVLTHRELRIAPSGEILVRGKTLFDGYLARGRLERPLEKGGWFATGDFGYLDSEERLVVTGRGDTMFISGGENIYPEEIESQIERIPGVRQALVVPIDDIEFGQRPVAFVLTDGRTRTPTEWKAELRKQLPGFKIPLRFLDWPEEEGESMKPDRGVFAERARSAMADE